VTASKSPAFLAGLAMMLGVCISAQARNEEASPPASPARVLSLDFGNNGQSVAARVGEQIEVTLGLVGPAIYGDPQISSPAIRLEETAMALRPGMLPSPGGPTFIYMFEAVTEGEVQIKVPVVGAPDSETARTRAFLVTIRVGPGAGTPSPSAHLRTDQANTEPWQGRWARAAISPSKSFLPVLRQGFVPSLPRLTGVEVELVAVHPGSPVTGDIEMRISDAKNEIVADVWKTVPTGDCSHVLFLLPGGGLQVSPGRAYTIQLVAVDGVFGWKYVDGGYREGAASAPNGSNPPLPDSHSSFLFKTFGSD